MRAALITAILLVMGFAYYLFQSTPARGPAKNKLSSQASKLTVTQGARRIAERRAGEDDEPEAVESTKTGLQDENEPEKKVEKGPFEISLGTHTLHSRPDRGQAIRVTVLLTVPDTKSRKLVYLQRRKLTRILYFLGAKRRADGARGPAGKDRFLRDVAIRFKNLIRTGTIDRIELRDYEVIAVDLPDLGAGKAK